MEENRTIKRELEKTSQEMDELKERVDTLKYLEEEASEENEILRYKVMSLEGQAAIDGQDLSGIKLVDELRQAKREMQSELEVLKTQAKSFKMLFGQSCEEEEPTEPLILLGHHKLESVLLTGIFLLKNELLNVKDLL